MEKYTNQYGKICYRDATLDTEFKSEYFNLVLDNEDETQYAFHSNLGSLTVLDRLTGFGWRDIESGYRDPEGKFWLASGNHDVMNLNFETIGDAIEYVKMNANTCIGE